MKMPDRVPPQSRQDAQPAVRRLYWVYGLAAVPFVTELVEKGQWPTGARGWLTELVSAGVILLLAHRLRKDHLAVHALARTDPLTGLLNRRAFDEAIEEECSRSLRSRQPLSLAIIDLDHFKLVNDRIGHEAGDRVLVQLAAAIRASVLSHVDRGFRLGGDEFALLLPGGTTAQARAVVSRIRLHCEHADAVWVGGPLAVSAGIVELAAGESAAALVRRADAEMYARKRAAA